MSNIKTTLVGLLILLLAMCSIMEVPEEITDPADQDYNLLAPTLLSANPLTDVQIELLWKNNEESAREFQILRTTGSSDYKAIAIVPKDELTFVDSNCVLGTNYSYSIKAQVESNQSRISNAITIATSFPAPPDLSANSVSDTELQLTWIDNLGYEAGFRIERDSGNGFTEVGTVSADVTEHTDSGRTYGQSYNYRVAAYTPINISSWATITTATEFSAPSDLSTISISDNEIQLNWTDNTGYETGFKIERDDGSGYSEIGIVSANVIEYLDSGLNYSQIYNYRVAAHTNSRTSDYCIPATALAIAPLVDYDGNIYKLVKIGNQIWMAENLKVTHYRDGTTIHHLTNNEDWPNALSGAFGFYNNEDSNSVIYGALYNWHAVNNSHSIAPDGWHVPTDDEWKELEMYIGMSQATADDTGYRGTYEGSILAGNHDLWIGAETEFDLENNIAFGTSGFDALPGGYRDDSHGNYNNIRYHGYFWSASEYSSSNAWARNLYYYFSDINRYNTNKEYGYSVRCVID